MKAVEMAAATPNTTGSTRALCGGLELSMPVRDVLGSLSTSYLPSVIYQASGPPL
jgi:hypothetical protein